MVNKKLEKVFVEPYYSSGGVSFNTNDQLICSGNVNGDVIIRSLVDSGQDAPQVTLTHQTTGRSEITAVRFSVVKRNVLASAYKNGQVVIWDTS